MQRLLLQPKTSKAMLRPDTLKSLVCCGAAAVLMIAASNHHVLEPLLTTTNQSTHSDQSNSAFSHTIQNNNVNSGLTAEFQAIHPTIPPNLKTINDLNLGSHRVAVPSSVSSVVRVKAPTGRYIQHLRCMSTACVVPGDADFIMTFMPDGTVHRLLIQKGKMSIHRDYTHSRAPTASLDQWTWDAERQQIRIDTTQGQQFFYQVNAAGQLRGIAHAATLAQPAKEDLNNPVIELDQVQRDAIHQAWQRGDAS